MTLICHCPRNGSLLITCLRLCSKVRYMLLAEEILISQERCNIETTKSSQNELSNLDVKRLTSELEMTKQKLNRDKETAEAEKNNLTAEISQLKHRITDMELELSK